MLALNLPTISKIDAAVGTVFRGTTTVSGMIRATYLRLTPGSAAAITAEAKKARSFRAELIR